MRRFLSLALCALLLVITASCGRAGEPEEVGSIGDTAFSAPLYRLLCLNAARAEPDGEEAALRQAVLLEMERYAAVEARFAQLGGEMGGEGQAYVEEYAPAIWEQSQSEMERYGVDKAVLEEYVAHLYREDCLLELIYGDGGEQPLDEEEILSYARDNLYYGVCVYLPLTGESGADIREDEAARQKVLDAAGRICLAGTDEDSLRKAAEKELPQVLALTGRDGDGEELDSYIYFNLFTPQNWQANLSEDAMEVLHSTGYGMCCVLDNGSSVTVFLRLDPQQAYGVEELRPYVTELMKREELDEALALQGAQLSHRLDETAMDELWS